MFDIGTKVIVSACPASIPVNQYDRFYNNLGTIAYIISDSNGDGEGYYSYILEESNYLFPERCLSEATDTRGIRPIQKYRPGQRVRILDGREISVPDKYLVWVPVQTEVIGKTVEIYEALWMDANVKNNFAVYKLIDGNEKLDFLYMEEWLDPIPDRSTRYRAQLRRFSNKLGTRILNIKDILAVVGQISPRNSVRF